MPSEEIKSLQRTKSFSKKTDQNFAGNVEVLHPQSNLIFAHEGTRRIDRLSDVIKQTVKSRMNSHIMS